MESSSNQFFREINISKILIAGSEAQCYILNLRHLTIKVVTYENLVSTSYLYVHDGASSTGERSELSLF